MKACHALLAGLLTLTLIGCTDQGSAVEDPGSSVVISFSSDIAPVLGAHCVLCHSAGGGGNAGLDLSSYAGLAAGGVSGSVVTPGEPDSSRLMQRIESSDPNVRMPSGSPPLNSDHIALVRDWIEEGAQNN